MRLVNEAVRDIMLYLEQNLNHKTSDNVFEYSVISYSALANELTPSQFYTSEEVKYAVIQLQVAGYILANTHAGKNNRIIRCDVYEITTAGHELIKSIKPNTIWQKVKNQAEKEGILSLTTLAKLCGRVTTTIAENPELEQNIIEEILG